MLKSWFYKTNLKDIVLFLLSVDVRFDEVCIYILKLAFTFPKTHNTGAEVIQITAFMLFHSDCHISFYCFRNKTLKLQRIKTQSRILTSNMRFQ